MQPHELPQHQPLVLVVDDDPVIRMMLKRFLEAQNIQVSEAVNGQVALDKINQEKPDLVLLDCAMPVMDGFEACQKLRSIEQFAEIPILMITSLEDEASVDKAFEAGASDYITKPINWAILRHRLHRMISSRQTQNELELAFRVLESTSEAVIIMSLEGGLLSVNRAFTNITGFTRDDVQGHSFKWLLSECDDHQVEIAWSGLMRDGHWQGELKGRRRKGDSFPQWLSLSLVRNSRGEAVNALAIAADISRIRDSEQQLDYLATHDPLTDLPNRSHFFDRLRRSIRQRQDPGMLAVMLIDLDRFKIINESLGHPIGDQLLLAVAERLKAELREGDTIARQGGDEFAVVLYGVTRVRAVADLANHLLKQLTAPFQLKEHQLHITSSIGISLCPADGTDAATLLRNAELAMYYAKDQGKNTFQFYSPEMNAKAMENLSLENDLRGALARNELVVFYQPKVDIASGITVGAEALIRWEHPKLGQISPLKFIPIAEEIGLINDIGQWVLAQACTQAKLWQQQTPGFVISVNVSPQQFRDEDLLDRVQATIARSGIDPYKVELELTEGCLMDSVESNIQTLEALKDLGVRLSVDDFGTGYSSLAYLKRFPVDVLKIDRSFVRDLASDPEDAAIVCTIISLAHSLKLEVVAEGVEDTEQLAFLAKQNCDQFQGYLCSRPVPPENFHSLLSAPANWFCLPRQKQKRSDDSPPLNP
ncbi:two-component system response regulator [Pelagibaculum spongiae]|uniref:cyclic-guanylate-specific phosphodiesterase n=1 Tax=Pelagibaculum spongiae TaxID=2080658 RepID=A0A2V1GYR0_9GAMM|nr:EAL domain-containing protein [Pelagibaculum spongiae]PVZ71906.1 diguanylate cyclase [Pelagibaculum spongiae]